jgi:hypothetical protein
LSPDGRGRAAADAQLRQAAPALPHGAHCTMLSRCMLPSFYTPTAMYVTRPAAMRRQSGGRGACCAGTASSWQGVPSCSHPCRRPWLSAVTNPVHRCRQAKHRDPTTATTFPCAARALAAAPWLSRTTPAAC